MSTKVGLVAIAAALASAVLAAVILLPAGSARRSIEREIEATRAEEPVSEPRLNAPEPDRTARPPKRARPHVAIDMDDPRSPVAADGVTVAGWIDLESGESASGAHVALLVQGEAMTPAAETRCDSAGVFRLNATTSGACTLVAYTPGHEPATRTLDLARGSRQRLDPIVLGDGRELRGSVTAGREPLPRAEVRARQVNSAGPTKLAGGALVMCTDHFEWSELSAETDARGEYVIRGLGACAHRVRVVAVRGRDFALDPLTIPEQSALPPEDHVDFEAHAAVLDLAFTCDGAPVSGVEVEVGDGTRMYARTADVDGRLRLRVSPALAYSIHAMRGGYGRLRETIDGLGDGERRERSFHLERHDGRGSVRLRLLPVTNQAFPAGFPAEFTFRSVDAVPEGMRAGSVAFVVSPPREADATFRIADVPAGRWLVTVRSGFVLREGMRTFCDTDVTLGVSENTETAEDVSIPPRRAIALKVVDEHGVPVEADVELRNARDEIIENALSLALPDGRQQVRERTSVETPTLVYSGLCSGALDLIAKADGFEPAQQAVSFVLNEPMHVDVRLHRH